MASTQPMTPRVTHGTTDDTTDGTTKEYGGQGRSLGGRVDACGGKAGRQGGRHGCKSTWCGVKRVRLGVYNLMDVVRRQLFCRRIVRRDARYWMVRLYWNRFGRSRNGTATRLKLWWHQPKLGYGSISRSVRSEARTRSFLVRCLDLP